MIHHSKPIVRSESKSKEEEQKSYGPAEGILYHIHMALHFTKKVVSEYLTAARDVRIIGQCINR